MERNFIELRFLIPQNIINFIVGPKGRNLDRLHGQYAAWVNIGNSAKNECVLSIRGGDLYIMMMLLKDILETVLKHQSSAVSECEICILADERRVDSMDDNDTEQIQRIVEETGCRIDFFPLSCPKSSERVVRVSGMPFYVSQCIYELSNLLLYSPFDGRIIRTARLYNVYNADPNTVAEYGGYVQPLPAAFTMPQEAQEEEHSSPVLTKSFTLPGHICGAIIGRSGSHLQQARHESGAKISLSDEFLPHSQNRLVHLTGTAEEIENARLLLQIWITVRINPIRDEELARLNASLASDVIQA